MFKHQHSRRQFAALMLSFPLMPSIGSAAAAGRRVSIRDFGALSDARTVNTAAIQAAIDGVAGQGGGTLVVPRGVFVSGALFLKPGVNLHLEAGAVLRCSPDTADFPAQRTRIEGHFEAHFTPALINAKGCDGLRISGSGTLDGAGRPVWDTFWQLQRAAPDPANFPNLSVPRARLALIESSIGVTIDGVTFKDSQFWNLHLYRCQDVHVRNARFIVPDDYVQAPSTDGIDLDSCRQVVIDGCYFSVTDDCIAAKGSKGPHALQDLESPPVEEIRIRNCHFRRGHHAFACGSEATIVRDVIVENCRVTGAMVLARLKLRADTPQRYENIEFRNITLDNVGGAIVGIEPWNQYRDLKGEAPPHSVVRDIRFVAIHGQFGAFGSVRPNPGKTDICEIVFRDCDLRLAKYADLSSGSDVPRFENVRINGDLVSANGSRVADRPLPGQG